MPTLSRINGRSDRRQRIDQLRERKSTARDERHNARQARDAAQQAGDQDAVAIAEDAIEEANATIETLNALEVAALRQMIGGVEEFGAELANNIQAQEALNEIANSAAPIRGNIHLGPLLSMDSTLGLFGNGIQAAVTIPDPTPSRRSTREGIAVPPQRTLSLLDLFASRPFEQKTIDYLRRSGGVAAAGIQFPEGAAKTQADVTYTDASAEAETFASYAKVLRQQLDDIGGLAADLQTTLRFGCMVQLEAALLNGHVASGMDGILTVGDVVEPVVPAATPLSDAVALCFRDLRSSGVEPTFAACSPTAYTDELLRKHVDGHYLSPLVDDPNNLHGKPIVQSVALTDTQVVAGDSVLAGYVGVRQPVHALVSDSDQDDFTANRLTILVELRAVPVIETPAALAVATLGVGG
jgi:hypothetical protein